MKALIIKDMINLKAQLRMFLLVIGIFFAAAIFSEDTVYFSSLMTMLVIMLPITTMAYDEKCRWDGFALTTPLSRSDMVNAKYMFTIGCIAVLTLLLAIGNLIICKDIKASISVLLYVIPAGMILNAAILPVLFCFGVESGRLVIIVVMIVIALLIVGFVKTDIFLLFAEAFDRTIWTVILWTSSVLITVFSLAASRRIYGGREF